MQTIYFHASDVIVGPTATITTYSLDGHTGGGATTTINKVVYCGGASHGGAGGGPTTARILVGRPYGSYLFPNLPGSIGARNGGMILSMLLF